GASYVVSGRLDRLGDALVLNVTLYDSRRGVALAKPSVQVAGVEELPIAVEKVAGEIHRALEVRAPPTAAPATGGRRGFVLGMKVGNQFLLSLTALSPGGDIDLGYRFDEEWVAFLQLGFNAVFAGEGDRTAQLSLFPSAVGARKLYRVDRAFQPYWALGLGLQLSIGDFALVTDTQGFPTVLGMAGFHYMLNKHLGLTVDASTNVAQTLLGFRRHPGESNVGAGLNFDLSVGFTYRF
ncbi:MAG: outer membrane beta-barrel protein, partial [Myxococcota bacterium]